MHELDTGVYDFVVVNYANADMVGHTGDIGAAVTAVETVDECLGRVVDRVAALGGVCLITADHGNSDNMLEPDGSPNTAHSLNLVPFVATVSGVRVRPDGRLSDLAPTVARPARPSGPARDDRPLAARTWHALTRGRRGLASGAPRRPCRARRLRSLPICCMFALCSCCLASDEMQECNIGMRTERDQA